MVCVYPCVFASISTYIAIILQTKIVQRMLSSNAEDRPSANEIKTSLLQDWMSAILELEDDSFPEKVFNIPM